MWYSARSSELVWSIAYLHLLVRDDDMVPTPVLPADHVPSSLNQGAHA
jgi:hypothetical protein